MQAVARATGEQVAATTGVMQSMRDIRGRSREITTALGAQARSAVATATDVAVVTREIASMREATAEQVDMVAGLARRTGATADPEA